MLLAETLKKHRKFDKNCDNVSLSENLHQFLSINRSFGNLLISEKNQWLLTAGAQPVMKQTTDTGLLCLLFKNLSAFSDNRVPLFLLRCLYFFILLSQCYIYMLYFNLRQSSSQSSSSTPCCRWAKGKKTDEYIISIHPWIFVNFPAEGSLLGCV